MRKRIDRKWLNDQGACVDAVRCFAMQKEQDAVKILNFLIEGHSILHKQDVYTRERLQWANWLMSEC